MGKETVVGQCRLCHFERELRCSHIIPEFLYKPLYDSKGRIFAVSTSDQTRLPFKIEQKGLREYLLCQSCETQLSRYEGVARTLFESGQLKVKGEPGVEVAGLDYLKLRLFFLSILWRSSVSTLPFFREVTLGPHEAKLREMILEEKPGKPWQYGCALSDLADKFEEHRLVIIQPVSSRADGQRHYFYVLGGFLWHYIVSSHRPEGAFLRLLLTQEGRMTVTATNPERIPFLVELRRRLNEQGKLEKLIERYGEEEA